MKSVFPLLLVLSTALTISSLAEAQVWLSEIDNLQVELYQRMFPVALSYSQQSSFGMIQVTNQTFQDELGKYELILLDRPSEDSRTPLQRIDEKIKQLQQSPRVSLLQVDPHLDSQLPRVRIDWYEGDSWHLEYLLIDGLREYHLRSDSFAPTDRQEVNQRLQRIAESFQLAAAPASYYAGWSARAVDAAITPSLWPDWHEKSQTNLKKALALATASCSEANPLTPAELVLEVSETGLVAEAFSSPRGKYGRCLELELIGLQLPPTPASQTLRIHIPETAP